MTLAGRTPCVLLAGGLGTRLRSVLADKPKCLAPVGTRSFLQIQVEALLAQGFDDLILALGYQSEQVLSIVPSLPAAVQVRTVVEAQPLGTGGAILHAMATCAIEEALVANGDTYLDGDLSALHAPLALAQGEAVRMAVVSVPDRARFGGVEVDAALRVTRFLEKGQHGAGAINAGLYRVHRQAFAAPQPGSAFSFESETLPALVALRRVRAQPIAGAFTDIGVPEDYQRFCADHG
jgi:D-glycero-alpha-D-manno-heptose 1-phosphate guanylyltransferase